MENILTIGISTRALFDLEYENIVPFVPWVFAETRLTFLAAWTRLQSSII